jgi:nucleotide-binding universal stress UspA family protein
MAGGEAMTRILLAVDGSEASDRAAKFVVRLAKDLASPPGLFALNADLPLMQAVAVKLGLAAVTRYHAENSTYALRNAKRILSRAKLEHRLLMTVGDAAEQIVEVAKANRVDLIVMGSRGQSLLKGLFVGSVATKVLAHSQIPVTLVR